ncbi:MAG: DUF4037 domain-containing protein [Anaerolinea sp.]|nr:DUF4037 domain-containing protein [Anaerolinea sp.]
MAQFIQGLELSRLYYLEAVQPILEAQFPALRYDAALIGSGSEVLGFDTPQSTDHHWGCRVLIFLTDADRVEHGTQIDAALRRGLPRRFRGYATSMSEIPDEPGVMRFDESAEGEVNHQVILLTRREFLLNALAWDGESALTAADWLTFPQQRLRAITAGGVWHSGLGELDRVREALAYYPYDVWLYLLAAGWTRIGQEEPFVGRCGDVGDELGSRVIAARLVRDIMMLCFLMEQVYAPYPKWYGTAFERLKCARVLKPTLERVFCADIWHVREAHLSTAYEVVAGMHNALGITEPLSAEVSRFYSRPYTVIHGERFAEALVATIADEEVKRIAAKTLIGGIDQYSDSTDFRDNLGEQRAKLTALYT